VRGRDGLTDLQGARIATTEARQAGFYWVILGARTRRRSPWERGEWWLAGDAKPLATAGTDRPTEGKKTH